MSCVFCNHRGRSREHVIASWLDGPLRASQRPCGGSAGVGRALITNRWTPGADTDHAVRAWPSDGPGLVTTSLCRRCNNDWLNGIETAARPLLEAMIGGQHIELDSAAQQAVSAWAYKTALLMQLVRPAEVRVIPRERYTAFYADDRPPTDARIWLGAVEGGPAMSEASTSSKLTSATSDAPAWVSVIALGNLLLLCAGRLVMTVEPLRLTAAAEGRALVPVWPASVRAVRWPPATILKDLDLTDLSGIAQLF